MFYKIYTLNKGWIYINYTQIQYIEDSPIKIPESDEPAYRIRMATSENIYINLENYKWLYGKLKNIWKI